MTLLSALLGIGSNGMYIEDPREFLRYATRAVSIIEGDSSPTQLQASSGSVFWTPFAAMGAASSSAWSANTYKTLVDVSGPGHLYNIVGPQPGADADTTAISASIRITVDNNAFEITYSAMEARRRQFIGMPGDVAFYGATFDWADAQTDIQQEGVAQGHILTTGLWLAPLRETYKSGQILKFAQSLKVEAKASSLTGQTTNGRFAGVQYRML